MLHSPLNRQCGTKSDYTFNSLYWVHWSHRPSPGEFLMPTTRQKHCHQSQWVCVYQQLISITILVEPRPPFPIWKGGPGFENITIVNFCKRVWPIHGLDSVFLATIVVWLTAFQGCVVVQACLYIVIATYTDVFMYYKVWLTTNSHLLVQLGFLSNNNFMYTDCNRSGWVSTYISLLPGYSGMVFLSHCGGHCGHLQSHDDWRWSGTYMCEGSG